MESAASNTYISKRMIEAYQKSKAERASKKQLSQIPAKTFSEEPLEEEKKEAVQKKAPTEQSEKKSGGGVMGFLGGMFGAKPAALKADSGSEEALDAEAYLERNLSVECIDSDDLAGELNLSDCEEASARRGQVKQAKASKRQAKGKKAQATKYALEVDTNVFEVQFACLKSEAALATGDPERCAQCAAILNVDSVVGVGADGTQTWVCEFCNAANGVELDEEERPKSAAVSYLVEAAAQVEDKKLGGGAQDISVVFCLDVSGSMCVSQAVEGTHLLRNDKKRDLAQALRQFGDGSDQFFSTGDKHKTYVSRLQCVQAAVDAQIEQMAKGAPARKVGVVTFNGEVTVLGDGSQEPQHLAGDKLLDFDFLQKNGRETAQARLCKTVGETAAKLQAQLAAVEETGPTALGPAVLTAVAMAAEGKPGSTVVVCTDGLSNVGLGAFDEAETEAELAVVEAFYERLGQFAQSRGVTINLVSIEGDDCNIESLSRICELTGGMVDRVNPASLTKNFANVLAKPVIATNVVTRVKLHKALSFRNELPQHLSADRTLLVKESGSVTEDSLFTFEYTIKTIAELLEMEDVDLAALKRIPFQAQISYTALDGSKMVRVITQSKAVSGEREQLEQAADLDMMQRNCIQQSSKIARTGDLKQAQVVAKGWNRHMRKNIHNEAQFKNYQQFNQNFGAVYNQINSVQEEQAQYDSDCEMAQAEMLSMQPPQQMMSAAQPMGRGLQTDSAIMKSAAPRKKAKASDMLSAALYKGSKQSKF